MSNFYAKISVPPGIYTQYHRNERFEKKRMLDDVSAFHFSVK